MDESSHSTVSNPSASDAYTVVARRYRPQTFDELIGQEHVAKALKQAIGSGRVGHAYLFTGARGVGKTSAARVLAKALNCVEGPTQEPCNQCEICQAVSAGEDVDTIEIDAASNTGVDNIRDLRQNASIKASRCRYKIYIIDEVHMLSKSAFNALLKTLEEPPEHVKFIFATTEPDRIPITILSRCQRFDFAGIESSAIAERLRQIAQAEGVEIDDEALAVLSIRAAGSMRDSQSLLEQLLAVAGSKITADELYSLLGIAPGERIGRLVTAIVDREPAAALANLDEAIANGADVGQMIDQLLGYFRDVMALVVGCDDAQLRYVLPSQYAHARELGTRLGVHAVLAMIQVLDQTSSRMRGSLHTRTLAEMALVRLAHLDDLDNLAAAIAELRNETPTQATTPRAGAKKNTSLAEAASALAKPIDKAKHDSPTPSAEAALQRVDSPAPAAVPPPVSLTDETVKQAWQAMTASMDGLLATQAEAASGVRLSDEGSVMVTFVPAARLSKDVCEQPGNRTNLERSLAEQLSCAVSLKFEVDASAESVDTTPTGASPPPRSRSRRQLQAEVSERPFVAKAMELFATDASKLRVTPPTDPSKR